MLRKSFFSYATLASIILFEGFVSISAEILTLRQLLPFTGSSVIVTSLVIGIFLLFLALGYQKGGKDHEYPTRVLCRNFFMAAILMGIGLSYPFIALFFHFVESQLGTSTLLTLTIYLLVITAPLIFILGQTVPITMNMVHHNLSVGKIGGNILGLSTIGSFLGAILTTLIFMHFYGVAWTILFNFIILSGLILLLAEKSFLIFYGLLILLAGYYVYIFNVDAEKNHFVLTNNYANYQILNHNNSSLKPGEKILKINGTYSSFTDPEGKGFKYIEVIKRILFNDMGLRNADILVLGAGGFSLTAENLYQNRFTYVDIDPQLSQVVVPQFTEKYQGNLIIDDARHFVKSDKHQYDVVILDVFSDIRSIPAHLLTVEFMQELKKLLKTNGTLIINVIANPFMQDNYSKRVDNTIRAVFNQCVTFPHLYANQTTNIIYACQNPKKVEDRTLYTDNLNNSTIDSL